MPPLNTPEKVWSRVDIGSGDDCWLWTGIRDRQGYGLVGFRNRFTRVHRFAYEQMVGPIPDGLVIDHLCGVTSCVNPRHLEPVTSAENTRRYMEAEGRRDRCKAGHEPDFLTVNRPGQPYRRCRACQAEASARWYSKQKSRAIEGEMQ